MAIRGKEGKVSAMHCNLFTASGGHKLQYIVWASPKRSREKVYCDSSFFNGERTHYGFPFLFLYVDRSTEDDSWYAKLDIAVLIVNYTISLIVSFGMTLTLKRRLAQASAKSRLNVMHRNGF